MSGKTHLDEIFIQDLEAYCVIGANDWERLVKQRLLLELRLTVDTTPAIESDRLEDSVNYRTISKQVVEIVEGSSFHLVESLAQKISDYCLSDKRVKRVTVVINKPGALREATNVGIRVTRDQER